MKTIGFAIVLAAFLFASQTAMAANHYIRAGASGSTCADWGANACNTLPASLTRGDTYYVADGNYSGRTFNTANEGSSVITIRKATIGNHGTDTGWDNSYGDGQAMFSGQVYFNSSFWVFDGVTGGGPGSWDSGFGFKVTETRDTSAVIKVGNTGAEPRHQGITISHVELQGKGSAGGGGSAGNDGVAIYGGSSLTVSHAWMHGIGRCPVFGYSQGVNIFEYIYVSSYYGSSAGHSEVASLGQNALGDFTWRYSLVTDIKSTGGLMWNGANNANAYMYVYGNVFYKPAGASWDRANGVIGGWTTSSAPFRNVRVYNNTFVNIDYLPLSNFPSAYSNNIAMNNVFYNCASPDFSRFATHDYNHFINSGGAHGEPNGTSDASEDPFVDQVNLNFALTSATAPGSVLPAPFSRDPWGDTRGADGIVDRGAFEFGGAGSAALLRPEPPTNLR